MSEQGKLAAALVAALGELTVIETNRTANAGSYSYDYADIADAVTVTRPVLAKNGLVALTPVHAHSDGLACTVILLHTSGERMDLGPFPFPHGRDAQATGSMVTYHRRYALIAALGMATGGGDDDGATATAAQNRQADAAAPEFDWGALGWPNQQAHDAVFADLKRDAGNLDKDAKATLKAWWDELSPRSPFTADFLEEYAKQIDLLSPAEGSSGGTPRNGAEADAPGHVPFDVTATGAK